MGFKRLKRNGLKKLLGIIKAKRSWAGKAFGTSLKLGKVWEKQHTKNDGSEDSVSTSEDTASEITSEDSVSGDGSVDGENCTRMKKILKIMEKQTLVLQCLQC